MSLEKPSHLSVDCVISNSYVYRLNFGLWKMTSRKCLNLTLFSTIPTRIHSKHLNFFFVTNVSSRTKGQLKFSIFLFSFLKKKKIEHSYVHLCTIVFGFGCNCILTKRIDLFACLCSTSQQTNIHTIWLNGNFMRTQRAKQAGSEKKRTQRIVRRDRDAYYNKAIHGKRQHRQMTIFLPRENAIRLSCDILFGFSVRFGLTSPIQQNNSRLVSKDK